MRILILGGTAEARDLAARLVARGHEVTTSLAGRTSSPTSHAGALRIGGFGGAAGLAAYLTENRLDRLIDATHPYAGQISRHAVDAADRAGVALLRLLRAPWPEPPAGWINVPDIAGAAAALPAGAAVLVTTGHESLEALLARRDCRFIVRLIEPPARPLPPHARLLLDRPPYTVEGERQLLRRETITHLVSKNAGGHQTSAKLQAAEMAGIAVIMIARPAYGPAHEVATVEAALAAIGA